jgi:hypothetical protein
MELIEQSRHNCRFCVAADKVEKKTWIAAPVEGSASEVSR